MPDNQASYWVKVDLLTVLTGEYTVELVIEELDQNGDLLSQTVEVKVVVTDAENQGIDADI